MAKPPTVSAVLAARVQKYRKERGWSVRKLAEECAKQGATTLTQASLTNIERGLTAGESRRGSRAVTVEEMLTLARVLSVPPVALMLPFGDSDAVEVCPGFQIRTYHALAWLGGMMDADSGLKELDWAAYKSALDPFWRLKEIEEATEVARGLLSLINGRAEKIIELRKKADANWEAEPDLRAWHERVHREENYPPPGSPMSDEEWVAQWREGARIRYQKKLREYSDALWRAADAGIGLPPVPSDLYQSISAMMELSAVEASRKRPSQSLTPDGKSRPLLPPNILIYEVGDDGDR